MRFSWSSLLVGTGLGLGLGPITAAASSASSASTLFLDGPALSPRAIQSAFHSPSALATAWTGALPAHERSAWGLRASVAADLPLGPEHPADTVTQLTLLSLVRGSAPSPAAAVSMCAVAFAGEPGPARGDACGLEAGACKADLETLAREREDCDFEIPESCRAASGRAWQKASAKLSTAEDMHFVALTSPPAKRGSPEARLAARAAASRPLLVITYGYSSSGSHGEPAPDEHAVRTHCLVPRPAKQPAPKVAVRDPGNAAANVTQVSLLVAAAAVLSAALMAF